MAHRPASLLVLGVLAGSSLLAGGAAAAPVRAPKLDPNVVRTLRVGRAGPSQRHVVRGDAPVVIELIAPATPAGLAELAAAGVELDVIDGEVMFYDRFVPARVDQKAAAALLALAGVERVTLRPSRGPLPLDHSASLVRLADARGARPALDRLTGAGVLIGDVDSLADIYHPTFFKADAGYFDWIDADGDGALTPEVDAIDLDRDGQADPGETIQVVRAETWISHMGGSVEGRPAGFDPSIDWLYLDQNGNGRRDLGAQEGFDDTAPAFGEPLFVPDDVDRSGAVDVGERVVRLGTSKFRAVNINLNYTSMGLKHKHVYQRGTDLSSLPNDFSHGALFGFDDALHATGVLSIVAGDAPLVGRRWVGFAPDAELALAFDVDQNESIPIAGAAWALKQSPDVMLYEMAPWTGLPLDGTDTLSRLIDESSDKSGVVHTCPTGDQGAARKHAHAEVSAGGSTSLALDLPSATKSGYGPLSYVEVSLHVQHGTPASISLHSPDGDTIDGLTDGQGYLATGAMYYVTSQVTPRDVLFSDLILYTYSDAKPLPTGAWTVTVQGGSSAVTVDAYVADDKSSWALGAGWDKGIATDSSTLGVPSTADHCIAVGAHPGHVNDASAPWFHMYYGGYDVPSGFAEAQGELRAYSPRGPRIDGLQKPDLIAPDNPWAAQQTGSDGSGPPYGSFQVFGGTSGASPHVTAAAALLVQAGLKGDAVRDALRAGAVSDATTGATPNGDYGYGRLDVAAALGVKTQGGAPSIKLTAEPASPTTRDTVVLTPEVSGGEGLEVKWDDDYDGTWDIPYAAAAPREVTSDVEGTKAFKARVRDAGGHIAEAVLWLTFTKASEDGTGGAGAPKPPVEGGGCGCKAVASAPELPGLLLAATTALAAARRRKRDARRTPASSAP